MSNTDNATTTKHDAISFGDQSPFILSFDSLETAKSKLDVVLSALIDSHLAIYSDDSEAEGRCPAVRFNVPVLIEDDRADGVKAAHTLLPELLAETSRLALERGFITLSVRPTIYSIADAIEAGNEINQETYGFSRCAGWSVTLVRWNHLENEALYLDDDGDPIYALWWTHLFTEEAHERATRLVRHVFGEKLGSLVA